MVKNFQTDVVFRYTVAVGVLWKRKPQQIINHECTSVNYTESAATEAQLLSLVSLSSP